MENQIVVGVTGLEGQAQLTWAINESLRWSVPLLVVHCYRDRYQTEISEPSAVDVDAAKTVLEFAVAAADRCGIVVSTFLGDGFPGEVLVEASEDAIHLVIGSSHRGRLSHAKHSSVSTYCVRHAHCPVTIVPGSTSRRES